MCYLNYPNLLFYQHLNYYLLLPHCPSCVWRLAYLFYKHYNFQSSLFYYYVLLHLRLAGKHDVKPSHEELKDWLHSGQVDVLRMNAATATTR
jgi:hypothetical protein